MQEPLASYLRPQNLDGFIGQRHLLWEEKALRSFIKNKTIPSMIFRWPPGVGKTTLAHIISKEIDAQFHHLSWVTSKKDDLKEIIEQAKQNHAYNYKTIIFLDEIHRRNKAQQDTLLPYVEDGSIILIWATTENPSFTINNALLSRSRVFVFESLEEEEMIQAIQQNMSKIQDHSGTFSIDTEVLQLIANLANGDLRTAYSILETSLMLLWWISTENKIITTKLVLSASKKTIYHERWGETHYNIISAIHKSLRDSDADAACYRIQRMLSAWEDPLYIARRLLRFASEDIGPADNNALLLANQTFEAIQKVWMPECDVFLFQLAIYLAKAPKDNIAYHIALETKKDVEKYGNLPVPMVIRNAPTQLMKDLGYGDNYKYAHNFKDAKVDQQHFPKELKGRKYTSPTDQE